MSEPQTIVDSPPCGHAKAWRCTTCSISSGGKAWHCPDCIVEKPMAPTNVYAPRPAPEQMKGAEDGFPGSDYP